MFDVPAVSYFYNVPFSGQVPSRQIFQCLGSETSLRQCPYKTLDNKCATYDSVAMVCSLTLPKPSFLFGSDQWQRQSVLHNVYFGNISGLHVSIMILLCYS